MLDLHAVNRIAVPTQSTPLETCRADESVDAELFRLFLMSTSGGVSGTRARGCGRGSRGFGSGSAGGGRRVEARSEGRCEGPESVEIGETGCADRRGVVELFCRCGEGRTVSAEVGRDVGSIAHRDVFHDRGQCMLLSLRVGLTQGLDLLLEMEPGSFKQIDLFKILRERKGFRSTHHGVQKMTDCACPPMISSNNPCRNY